jgi:hypothetical protein
MNDGDGVARLPEGSRDIRHWNVFTFDGLWVAAMSEDMYIDLQAAFGSEEDRRHIAREIVGQANRLDTLTPEGVGYPRYEVALVPADLRSDRVRLEGFGPDRVWIFYPNDPVLPLTDV